MPGVDPNFITHKLNIDPLFPSKKQKLRRPAKQRVEAVKEKLEKLKQARAIKEVFFPEWLSNMMVVRKKNGKWKVYVNFTDLNRAWLKDPFPIPKINQLVNTTCGHSKMSFLDAFQRYHHITLTPKDPKKTSFIIPEDNYHYIVMPFRLKKCKSHLPMDGEKDVHE